jgi:hypothetical protein
MGRENEGARRVVWGEHELAQGGGGCTYICSREDLVEMV